MNMNGNRRNSVFAPDDPVKVHSVVFVSWTWSTAMGIRMFPRIMVMIRPIQSPALLSALVSAMNLCRFMRNLRTNHCSNLDHSFLKFVFSLPFWYMLTKSIYGMLLYIKTMLQREWRTWKLLVYCSFIPLFIVRFLPMSQFWMETGFSVSLMFFFLTAIHGFQMIYLMN